MVVKSTDLQKLENYYGQQGNQLVFLYGKKDCEKEELLKEFVKNKKVFYYRARQASEKAQRQMMAEEVSKTYDVKLQEPTYREFFKRIKSNDPSKLVVVIDEVQNIMKKDDTFWDAVVMLKEKKLYPGPVMIILTSSSVVWSEGTILSEETAYSKKLSLFLKLEDFSFLDVVRAFPDFSVADSVALYGVLGGTPGYMKRWNKHRSFKDNICDLVLTPGGYLFDKAEETISAELRELSVYNTILSAIASGKNKLNDLYLETGYSRAKISVYMKNLNQFDIVDKLVSFETGGWDNAKKGVYEISDTYVNFWFRFVYPHLSDLYTLTPSQFYDRYIRADLDAYLNRYFVSVCKEYLMLLNQMNRLPVPMVKMGSWLGKTGTIDIIAQSEDRRNLVGLCNWEKPEVTYHMVENLFNSMEKARVNSDHIYIFSAKGFAPSLVQKAKEDPRLELIDMKEL